MRVKIYSIEELVSNDDFCDWVLKKPSENVKFWEQYIKLFPEESNKIEKARELVILLNGIEEKGAFNSNERKVKEEVWKEIIEVQEKEKYRFKPLPFFYYAKRIAAGLIVMISLSAIIYLIMKPTNQEKQANEKSFPVRNTESVKLTLADGSNVNLDQSNEKNIIEQNGIIIRKLRNTLEYDNNSAHSLLENFNTLEIPFGKKYNIVLADGTKVWLNSGSKIKYPTVFNGNTRTIYLKGEAYFDVVRNESKPFIVNTSDVNVQVLGTAFNISTYDNDRSIEITLVSGKVSIYKPGEKYTTENVVYLEPEQKASYSKSDSRMSIDVVNTRLYTSWREGVLTFKNEKLENMVPKLERWYNIDMQIKDININDLRFTGVIREEKSIKHILELIQTTCPVSYNIIDDKVILYNKLN